MSYGRCRGIGQPFRYSKLRFRKLRSLLKNPSGVPPVCFVAIRVREVARFLVSDSRPYRRREKRTVQFSRAGLGIESPKFSRLRKNRRSWRKEDGYRGRNRRWTSVLRPVRLLGMGKRSAVQIAAEFIKRQPSSGFDQFISGTRPNTDASPSRTRSRNDRPRAQQRYSRTDPDR